MLSTCFWSVVFRGGRRGLPFQSHRRSCKISLRLWCTSTLDFCTKHHHPDRIKNITSKKHVTFLWHAFPVMPKNGRQPRFCWTIWFASKTTCENVLKVVDIQSPRNIFKLLWKLTSKLGFIRSSTLWRVHSDTTDVLMFLANSLCFANESMNDGDKPLK